MKVRKTFSSIFRIFLSMCISLAKLWELHSRTAQQLSLSSPIKYSYQLRIYVLDRRKKAAWHGGRRRIRQFWWCQIKHIENIIILYDEIDLFHVTHFAITCCCCLSPLWEKKKCSKLERMSRRREGVDSWQTAKRMWIGGRGVDEKKCVSITSEEDFSELFYVLLCHRCLLFILRPIIDMSAVVQKHHRRERGRTRRHKNISTSKCISAEFCSHAVLDVFCFFHKYSERQK